MVSNVLPLLVAAAGIGASARALPMAQGVTELLTPGASPSQCTVTAGRTFGVSIAAAGAAAPLKKRQDVTQIADGQLQAMGNAGFVGNNAIDVQAANAAGAFVQGVNAPEIDNIAVANVAVPQTIAAASAGLGFGSATQIYDGQVQAPASVAQAQALTGPAGFGSASVSQIYDGQIQAPGFINQIQDMTPVNQIYDGQLQAANQIYGAQAFASQPIAPINQFETLAPINQIYDGQLQAPGFINQIQDINPLNQIYDGQVQAVASQSIAPINQIYDGQLQAVNQIYDGQLQAPGFINQVQDMNALNQVQDMNALNQIQDMNAFNQIYDGQVQAVASQPIAPLNQIYDGQVQSFAQVPEQFSAGIMNVAPAALDLGTVTQIYDGQIQAPAMIAQAQAQAFGPIPQAYNAQVQTFGLAPEVLSMPEVVYTPEDALYTTNQVTQIMDGQIQAPAGIVEQMNFPAQVSSEFIGVPQSPSALVPQSPAVPMTQITDGQVQFAKRQNGVPVALSLNGGVLSDNLGRTGYIASNRQLQFDAPPQGGAIYTAGFSACNDNTLALGGSNTFYACGSSDFNNIYDQAVNANCRPINLVLG
ncbi:hypothetical protein Q9L58_005192 [Maublancomyces gigas]|uniref:Cell wall mannoprotein PIR1-like C-terminal domain-containing protein n=1 Tax=Discina gigas TaxID=1032678 RepID=A0ABR3GIZ5_9PEZI